MLVKDILEEKQGLLFSELLFRQLCEAPAQLSAELPTGLYKHSSTTT